MNVNVKKKIIIIGTGWYGCHIALILSKYKEYDITIIEKNDSIFNNSSYYNQNRLHLGYHYCRNYPTRNLCQKYYDKFINQYSDCVDHIDNNYYVISNHSLLDFKTFNTIYSHEKFDFEILKNNLFQNIDEDLIKVKEQVINSDKVKKMFEKKLFNLDNVHFLFNTKVISLEKKEDNTINVNCDNEKIYQCDLLLDCTYNQLQLSKKEYKYELTISLVMKQIKDVDFGALTIMDGKLLSLYPRDIENKLFTLTDVEYTPIITSYNYSDIENYQVKEDEIFSIKEKMFEKIKYYYPEFKDIFEYHSYFLSKKTKMTSTSDSRDITIEEIDKNIISVNCGKIYGIFDFEEFILSKLHIY
jgi:hypothetical protein